MKAINVFFLSLPYFDFFYTFLFFLLKTDIDLHLELQQIPWAERIH